jgi:uncharacterized membrane protein
MRTTRFEYHFISLIYNLKLPLFYYFENSRNNGKLTLILTALSTSTQKLAPART